MLSSDASEGLLNFELGRLGHHHKARARVTQIKLKDFLLRAR